MPHPPILAPRTYRCARSVTTAGFWTALLLAILVVTLHQSGRADGLGSASTIAISHTTSTVCGILAAAGSPGTVRCAVFNSGVNSSFDLFPASGFSSISGGGQFLCGVRPISGSGPPFSSLFCWPASNTTSSRRVYYGPAQLEAVSVGEDHVGASERGGGIRWWRGEANFPADLPGNYTSLTSGNGFSCAVEANSSRVRCWGDATGVEIEEALRNQSIATIVAGDAHACGINTSGVLVCVGKNESGQLGPVSWGNAADAAAFEFSTLALGRAHTCLVRRTNGTVVCWGGGGSARREESWWSPTGNASFELLVAGGDLTCGVATQNFSVVCWSIDRSTPSVTLPLLQVLPGLCTGSGTATEECPCGPYPDSERLCSGSGVICNLCEVGGGRPETQFPPVPPLPPPQPPSSPRRKGTSKGLLAFGIIGSVGAVAGICSVLYCAWTVFCRRKKVHNSVHQPPITRSPNSPPTGSQRSKSTRSRSKSSLFRRQISQPIRRQRSGPSSSRRDRAEEFTLEELSAASNGFSATVKLGAGSFGTVYKGRLADGREVAIKRGDIVPIVAASSGVAAGRRLQEKESAFESELAFLSRLHHKHLVGLVGFCEDHDERLLVYEYMPNGALYDHLHGEAQENSPLRSSWRMRIKAILDAARGVEYLHNYAVPAIIHRDIKSSNILLDNSWTARVSDFGLSLLGMEGTAAPAAGTVGYMDPEYYGQRHLTTKSDVYGIGVVMLECITGKRAVFRRGEGEDGQTSAEPTSLVDFAAGRIEGGGLAGVLDRRLPPPPQGSALGEAVDILAQTAVRCVRMEGRERPTMSEVVSSLETALALCDDGRAARSVGRDDSIGSISSASFSYD